jgi:hypothetical protein
MRFSLEVTSCADALKIWEQRLPGVEFPYDNYHLEKDNSNKWICNNPLVDSVGLNEDDLYTNVKVINQILDWSEFLKNHTTDEPYEYSLSMKSS